jgi:general secretion pathway protein A
MYTSFFKLQRSPFEISPDPQFFFRTDVHNEALAGLYYGIYAHKGFMVLSGEVGTGKTLVIRCLLDLLDQTQLSYAYIFCTRLSSWEFLQEVAKDWGLPDRPRTQSQLLKQFQSFLLRRGQKGLYTALIIDEAQHLDAEVLEEVRLLTNFETARGKLLQIILVGQPELDVLLESHNLRQLKQRIAMRFRLRPLSEAQTRNYIWDRLWQAGSHDPLFSLAALQSVFIHSGGIPRLINTICDNALISAFAAGRTEVTDTMVEEVAADLYLVKGEGHGTAASPPPPARPGTCEEDPWREFSQGKKEDGDCQSVGATT